MYCKYVYSSYNQANMLSDIIAILTGETNVNNLSATCDKANTTITAAVEVAGWTVYDASAGTNAKCIRAAISDDGSNYYGKYIVVDTNSSGYLYLKLYESWNSGSHSGTNPDGGYNQTAYQQRVNASGGGTIYIRANANSVVAYSNYSSTWGNSATLGMNLITEYSRLAGWATIANAYPKMVNLSLYAPGVIANANVLAYTRIITNTGADSTTGIQVSTSTFGCVMSVTSGTGGIPITTVPADSSKTLYHALYPLWTVSGTYGFYGEVSSFSKVYLTTYNFGAHGDELTVGSNTYVIWACGSYRFALLKG